MFAELDMYFIILALAMSVVGLSTRIEIVLELRSLMI